MRNNDTIRSREELRVAIQQAVRDNDTEAFSAAFDEMQQRVALDIREEFTEQMNQMRQEFDANVLASRGVRQLTSEERNYYQKLGEAMRAKNPKQALENMEVAMPETVIDSVFEDLRTNHPLLSLIDFIPTNGAIELLMNTNGYQEAAWGELCDEIVTELAGGFQVGSSNLLKLSAFLPVCKAMLDLGPEWIDRFVRETLYEALANGLEAAIVTGGVYPAKVAIPVTDLSPASVGALIAQLAINGTGHARAVNDVLLLVNPVDYFSKVMPATTVMAPDGTYRNDVLPYPMTVIQVPALAEGTAVIGPANRYFATAGTAKEGRIEASDHAKFLEDKRVYLIKAYANGMPKDNSSFLVLDISDLKPASLRVEMVAAE